jgi:hypothetical protein
MIVTRKQQEKKKRKKKETFLKKTYTHMKEEREGAM